MQSGSTGLFAVFSTAVVLFAGCQHPYLAVGGSWHRTEAEAAAENKHQAELILRGIKEVIPVKGKALFALPSREQVQRNWIIVIAGKEYSTPSIVEAIFKERELLFAVLKKRRIFNIISLVYNADPAATPLGDYDYLIYLQNPNPKFCRWYLKKADQTIHEIRSPVVGRGELSVFVSGWLDSIVQIVRVAEY